MTQTESIEEDPYASAADALIAQCAGDARRAVVMLLGANEYLDRRVQALEASVSPGYVRTKVRTR